MIKQDKIIEIQGKILLNIMLDIELNVNQKTNKNEELILMFLAKKYCDYYKFNNIDLLIKKAFKYGEIYGKLQERVKNKKHLN